MAAGGGPSPWPGVFLLAVAIVLAVAFVGLLGFLGLQGGGCIVTQYGVPPVCQAYLEHQFAASLPWLVVGATAVVTAWVLALAAPPAWWPSHAFSVGAPQAHARWWRRRFRRCAVLWGALLLFAGVEGFLAGQCLEPCTLPGWVTVVWFTLLAYPFVVVFGEAWLGRWRRPTPVPASNRPLA